MSPVEAAKLLTIASGFDRRTVDELTATAWAAALADVSFEDGQAAVLAHFTDAATRHSYFTVGHVLDRVEAAQRLARHQVESDVRSAKARGLVAAEWPDREPLPASVAGRLAVARRGELDAVKELTQ